VLYSIEYKDSKEKEAFIEFEGRRNLVRLSIEKK
jgi:hypothetical protein